MKKLATGSLGVWLKDFDPSTGAGNMEQLRRCHMPTLRWHMPTQTVFSDSCGAVYYIFNHAHIYSYIYIYKYIHIYIYIYIDGDVL